MKQATVVLCHHTYSGMSILLTDQSNPVCVWTDGAKIVNKDDLASGAYPLHDLRIPETVCPVISLIQNETEMSHIQNQILFRISKF